MVGVSEFAPEAQGLAGFLQDPVHLIPFHRHDHGTSSESAIPSFPYLTYKLVQDIDTFYFLFYFLKDFIYLFLERAEGRERNINLWVPLVCPPTGDLARNPGMCPDWELSQ